MIEQTSFLGIPLRTRRQRRLFVAGYYLALLILLLPGLLRGRSHFTDLGPMLFPLGSFLGGIRPGGPVKYYNPSRPWIQSLNLSGRRSFNSINGIGSLDEREMAQRDGAHFKAYQILTLTLLLLGLVYWAGLIWNRSGTYSRMPITICFILIYALSLPQAVLLWMEPEAPLGALLELPVSPS